MDKEDSALRTIGEVAEELNLPAHVLRFWETKFTQLKPNKRRGRHRYYRPEDIERLKQIRHLLYEQGFTIRGAQKYLRLERKSGESSQVDLFAYSPALKEAYTGPQTRAQAVMLGQQEINRLKTMLEEIKHYKELLSSD